MMLVRTVFPEETDSGLFRAGHTFFYAAFGTCDAVSADGGLRRIESLVKPGQGARSPGAGGCFRLGKPLNLSTDRTPDLRFRNQDFACADRILRKKTKKIIDFLIFSGKTLFLRLIINRTGP